MKTCHKFLVFVLLKFVPLITVLATRVKALTVNHTVSAIYVFGDSTVDPGNNNYLPTIFKSNFPPYGIDYPNHSPTGRFTNGRLATDYMASYLGIKEYVPPYLDPTLSTDELLSGVSFASAGSGLDPITPKFSSTMGMPTQMEKFKEYKKRLESIIGKRRSKEHIKRAFYLVSACTNDFLLYYIGPPIRSKTYSVSGYQHFVLQLHMSFVQGLWDLGARRMAIVGLPPIGCLPAIITLKSDNAFHQRDCIEYYTDVSRDYNRLLQSELNSMQHRLANAGARIYYANIYDPTLSIVQDPRKYGFDDVSTGCCGTGYIEVAFLCNPKSVLCSNADKYLFWDSIHPTEMAYYIVQKALLPTIDLIAKD